MWKEAVPYCSRGDIEENITLAGLRRDSNTKLSAEQIVITEYRSYTVLISTELPAKSRLGFPQSRRMPGKDKIDSFQILMYSPFMTILLYKPTLINIMI